MLETVLMYLFQSTLSSRRATLDRFFLGEKFLISIHALLAESDVVGIPLSSCVIDFNPRSPCGERRFLPKNRTFRGHFNPRSPCGERPVIPSDWAVTSVTFQSTLSLRRATVNRLLFRYNQDNFNPRSPCGERLFNCCIPLTFDNFNPRSPCGERLQAFPVQRITPPISIHALLAESDAYIPVTSSYVDEFQSTLSLRRATQNYGFAGRRFVISIHALLAESDRPGRV